MQKIQNLMKWIMRKFRGDDYTLEGDNVVYDESTGNIRFQYSFDDDIADDIRAQHMRTGGVWRDDSVIRYHLTQYVGSADLVWLFLVEDTIHELTHWALSDEDNAEIRGNKSHWNKWRKVIYSQLEYVHGLDISHKKND